MIFITAITVYTTVCINHEQQLFLSYITVYHTVIQAQTC